MTRRLLLFRLAALGGVTVLLAGCFLAGCARPVPAPPAGGYAPTIVLVSIDGFRWDYVDRYEAPALSALAAQGVRARHLIPAFPTKTFPNHYTLVTGLYPARHGIVSNTMYDPEMDASFRISDTAAVRDARWWGGEPIWVTAERQGRKTAAFFWPGSEAPIQGVRPTYFMRFDDTIPGERRVDKVLAWLDLPPADRPAFATLYFSDVDHAGHEYGPDSDSVAAAVRRVDGYLARLDAGLRARGLDGVVNLIVVSDHGMAATSPERAIVFDDYVDPADVRVVDRSPVLMLYAGEGKEDSVLAALKRAPHLSVYRKEEIPADLHFHGHRRITPIVAIADEGWAITTRAWMERDPGSLIGGAHGYDPAARSMGALFVARGPAFKKGVVVEPFQNIHLYPLMASILGLRPAETDGRLDSVRTLLRTAP